MTSKERIRQLINSMGSDTAWSPMPEHLLFLKAGKGKDGTPTAPDAQTGEQTCEECGMQFKTEAMLAYHKLGFCLGKTLEELPPTSHVQRSGGITMSEENGQSYTDGDRGSAIRQHTTKVLFLIYIYIAF